MIVLSSIILVSLTSCLQNAFIWDWNYYKSVCRFKANPSPENKKAYFLSLQRNVTEDSNIRSYNIPPSVRLELSELQYKDNAAKANKFLKEELRIFPESKKLIDLLLLTR